MNTPDAAMLRVSRSKYARFCIAVTEPLLLALAERWRGK